MRDTNPRLEIIRKFYEYLGECIHKPSDKANKKLTAHLTKHREFILSIIEGANMSIGSSIALSHYRDLYIERTLGGQNTQDTKRDAAPPKRAS